MAKPDDLNLEQDEVRVGQEVVKVGVRGWTVHNELCVCVCLHVQSHISSVYVTLYEDVCVCLLVTGSRPQDTERTVYDLLQ